MNEFDISVVIPTYNSIDTIERALNSVLSQVFLPKEVIVIDDASTDGTLDFLLNYKSKNERSIIIHILKNEKNSGPSHSRNRGIEESKGNWIAFLDSDDYWHPRKLEVQVKLLGQHQAKIIGSIAKFQRENEDLILSEEVKIITSFDMLWKNYFQTPTVLIQKNSHLRFNTEMSYAEDFDLWSRMIREFGNGLYMENPLIFLGKAPYLHKGLSSNLVEMELGEIKVLDQEPNVIFKFISIIFSVLKFFRRVIFSYYYHISTK